MFLTGFSDEASADFAVQLKATQELGWKFIESRNINGKNLASLSEAEFDVICQLLDEYGIAINCYGSSIANWSKDPRSAEAHEADIAELTAVIPRMKRLGIKMLRGMSFAYVKDTERPDLPEIEKQVFSKVQKYVDICADNGIIYGHENCMNYGGLSWRHTLKLLDNIKGENFTLIFDTGNPVFNYDFSADEPCKLQSAWEFYRNVREFISYIHIKDSVALPGSDWRKGVAENIYTWPGEGCGNIRAIVKDLLKNGYDGGFSMEPHVASVYHDGAENAADFKYSSYIEYGKRFEALLDDCRKSIMEVIG